MNEQGARRDEKASGLRTGLEVSSHPWGRNIGTRHSDIPTRVLSRVPGPPSCFAPSPSSTFFEASPSISATLDLIQPGSRRISFLLDPNSFPCLTVEYSLGDTQGFSLEEFCGMFCAAHKRSRLREWLHLCSWCDFIVQLSQGVPSINTGVWKFQARVVDP